MLQLLNLVYRSELNSSEGTHVDLWTQKFKMGLFLKEDLINHYLRTQVFHSTLSVPEQRQKILDLLKIVKVNLLVNQNLGGSELSF